MPKAKITHSTSSIQPTAIEALFLRCILQCQNDYGMRPPAELGLPRMIVLVVDYDYVKRMMFTKLLRDDTDEGIALCREQTYLALKAARSRLMAARVVGCHDPFVWWTGKPVNGVKETIRTPKIMASSEVRL